MSIGSIVNSRIVLPTLAGMLFISIALLPFFSSDDASLTDEHTEDAANIEVLFVANNDSKIKNVADFSTPTPTPAESMPQETANDLPEIDMTQEASVTEQFKKSMPSATPGAKQSALPEKMSKPKMLPESTLQTTATEPTQFMDPVAQEQMEPERVCYEFGPLKDDKQKAELESQFQLRGMLTSLKLDTVQKDLGYWVFLPPVRSQALGRLKVEEIKLKGIKDVNLLVAHEPKLAISLGMFKNEKNANKRMLHAQSIGLDARIDIRHVEQNEMWIALETRRENDLSEEEWMKLMQQYSPIELKTTVCP